MIRNVLVLDWETYYSRGDFSLSGNRLTTPEYILDPRFAVHLLAAYDLKWPAPKIIDVPDIPAFLARYPAGETMTISHNALFDMAIFSWKYGWVPAKLQDTLGMARALRRYKRNSLGSVAKELFGVDSKGDVIGKVSGMNIAAIKQAGLWPDYRTYAMHDARLCMQIYLKLLPEFPSEEQTIQDLVIRAAIQPQLHADVGMLEQHLIDLRKRKLRLLRESNYDKAQLMSTDQFKRALEDLGVEVATKMSPTGRIVPAFAKTDPFMAELTEYGASEDDEINFQVQTLASARLAHKSTIEETRAEKFYRIAKLPWKLNGSRSLNENPPLLPVALRYGGAHTGRLSGEWGLNMQNLPRDKIKSKLRSAIMAPPRHKLITADLSQIEARIVAVLCGQTDLVAQFARGEDVYANFASTVFQRRVTKKFDPHERFLGKTAILGLGYGCGIERFYQMVVTQARAAGIPLEGLFDKEIAQKTVDIYRATFSRIPAGWRKLDLLLAQVINNRNPAQTATFGPVLFMSGRIRLPNGMFLHYQIGDPHLYGAKLLENITQALARIVVMQAAVRLARLGYRFALQAHDELVFVVPDAGVEGAKDIIKSEMVREPEWLPGVPLAVEIGVGQSYGEAK